MSQWVFLFPAVSLLHFLLAIILKCLLWCIFACRLSSFNRPYQNAQKCDFKCADLSRDHECMLWFAAGAMLNSHVPFESRERLSTAVAGRGLNSIYMHMESVWRKKGRDSDCRRRRRRIRPAKDWKSSESDRKRTPSQTHYLMKSWASTNIRYLILQITAKRRQCPPDAWSEGAIVSTILKNYTKMLPIAEDPIQVLVEIHVQVKGFSIYQRFFPKYYISKLKRRDRNYFKSTLIQFSLSKHFKF